MTCILANSHGPTHQTATAAHIAAQIPIPEMDPGHPLSHLARAALTDSASGLAANSNVVEQCALSVTVLIADGRDCCILGVGDVYAYLMSAGYASPIFPALVAPLRPGQDAPPVEGVDVRLASGEWLVLSTVALEQWAAPVVFDAHTTPSRYLSGMGKSPAGLQANLSSGLMVSYLPE